MKNEVYALNLEGEAFNALKMDFNQILNALLNTMLQKESENAVITVKLKVSLSDGTAPDLAVTAYHADRDITVPKFEHNISSVVQIKDKKEGYVGGDNYEMFWDKESKCYAIRPIKASQCSLYEEDYSSGEYETEDNDGQQSMEDESPEEGSEDAPEDKADDYVYQKPDNGQDGEKEHGDD